jgi:hypothetical protein
MALKLRLFVVIGVLALAASGLSAQRGAGGAGGGGRAGGGQGPGGRGPGPLVDPTADPAQLPPGIGGGRGGRQGGPNGQGGNQPAPKGTGKIGGRIVSSDTGSPIRRAQVTLAAPAIRVNRTDTTDNDGRYEFADLPAGRYQLRVSKAGYVTLEYGQARPFESGKPLDLVEATPLLKTDFSLPRGSVITGRVADEFGDPIADVSVQAMRYQFTNGQRQLVAAGRQGTTDDIGQYRIFGLMPGDYVVRATVRTAPLAAAVLGPAPAPGQPVEEPSGYPPTYFPGVTDIGQAQTVTVALGQELASISLSLSPARLARISGNAVDSQGHPLNGAAVLLRPANGGGAGGPLNVGGANQVRTDGSFVLNNVAPGEYTIDVQQRPRNLQQGLAAPDLEFASIPLSVNGADITGLTIITTPGVTATGKVVLQTQKPQATPLRGLQVGAMTPSGSQSILGIAGRALGGGRVADDGTFSLRGLAGPQMIRMGNVPAGWMLKSITLEGQDITDTAFDFKPGRDVAGITVTLTDRLTDLSGAVHDVRGQVVKDYVLVVFPQDSKFWGGQSRFVRTARPNQDGVYSLKGLPPGQYYAVAVESLETGTQNDPAVLERLKAKGKVFSLTEAQTLTLDLSFQP